MDQELTRHDDEVERATSEAGGESGARNAGATRDDGTPCEPVEHDRPAGVPPAVNDDLEGHDESIAGSFPASDPPANY